MKRDEKINLIREFVKTQFENENDKDTICEMVFGEYPGQIKFSELPGLVYTIGREEGFIKSVKEMRSDAQDLMDELDLKSIETVKDLHREADGIAVETGAKSGWARLRLKEMCKEIGHELTHTRMIGGWRAVMVQEVRKNPEVTRDEMIKLIAPHTRNPKDNTVYFLAIIKAAYNNGFEDGQNA